MVEPGQDRKIAALRSSVCVHFFLEEFMNDFMKVAVEEAKIAGFEGNVPVGSVIVYDNKIISKAHNTKNTTNIAVNHAEILCIIEACKYLNSWYLTGCELFVTLKPCEMCIAAIAEARIKKVHYLIDSNYSNNMQKNISNINFNKFNDIYNYDKLISGFFENLRDSDVSRET